MAVLRNRNRLCDIAISASLWQDQRIATEPPDDLEFFLALVLAGEHAHFLVREEFEAAGVEVYVWGLLVHVAAAAGATPSQLAAETGTTHSTIRDQVQSLVDRGLLERVPHPRDGRSYRLELTARGRASVERGLEASARARERIEAELGRPLEPIRQDLLDLTRAASRARSTGRVPGATSA